MNRRTRILMSFAAAFIALPLLARAATAASARTLVFSEADTTPQRRVAIVYGARVVNDYPSAMLYDRVAAAVDLYRAGRVQVLLMSGGRRGDTYDEPAAMRRTAIELGVPASQILIDEGGFTTYDTCLRASTTFALRDAVLVTQRFHLDRALLLCRGMGMDAVGFSADRRPYRSLWWSHLREVPATVNAMIELWVTRPGAQVAGFRFSTIG